MTRYDVLLRGINVGGVTIKMAELAELVRGLGYSGVKTVLASGNVVLESDDTADAVKDALQTALRERFGYEAWVHVLAEPELRAIVDGYPFERGRDGWHDYVVFVLDPERRTELLAVPVDEAVERIAPGDRSIYWTVPKGDTLQSVFGKAQGAARHKPWLTTRNVNTFDKLLA